MRPYHEAFPTCGFRVRVGLVSWICPGVPFRESGVLLPGAAPSDVAQSNVAAVARLSTRNIKHLSSLKSVLLTRCVKVYLPKEVGVNPTNREFSISACHFWKIVLRPTQIPLVGLPRSMVSVSDTQQ